MIRPFLALPFLAVAWFFLKVGQAFSDVASWIDSESCARCGEDHD